MTLIAVLPILIMSIIMVALIQSSILLEPYSHLKAFYQSTNQVPFSHITRDEADASTWIRQNVDVKKYPNSLILSDYATSYLTRGMTGLNSTASRHPFMSPEDWQNMQKVIKNIYSSQISTTTYKALDKIRADTQSEDMYLVLSLRTCWWLNQQDAMTIRYLPMPTTYTFNNYCSQTETKFQRSPGFNLVYHNDEVAIFKYNSFLTKGVSDAFLIRGATALEKQVVGNRLIVDSKEPFPILELQFAPVNNYYFHELDISFNATTTSSPSYYTIQAFRVNSNNTLIFSEKAVYPDSSMKTITLDLALLNGPAFSVDSPLTIYISTRDTTGARIPVLKSVTINQLDLIMSKIPT